VRLHVRAVKGHVGLRKKRGKINAQD
jgi:hypothetical protein